MARRGLAAALVLVLGGSTCGGCYLSHERTGDAGRPIDARFDVPRLDASLPDVLPDVPPPESCERLSIVATASLAGEARGAVTPRVTGLPDGSVGVVYVRTDGDPTRVLFERRDRNLSPVVLPTTIARDSFTWAEIALVGDRVFIPFGTGDGASAIQALAFDGSGLGRVRVEMQHPSLFFPSSRGYFWANFDSRGTNGLVMTTVDPSGALLHDLVRIELGRYGSGHHALVAPDPRRVILGYSREGPPGVRRGYLNAMDERGTLGPERQLSDGDITSVFPLQFQGDLVTVWDGDALGFERDDWNTLEMLEQVTLAPIEGTFVAGTLGDHVVIARIGGGRLSVDVYDDTFSLQDSLDAALPTPTIGSGSSATNVPGALVVAFGLTAGSDAFPWLARIECVD